MNFQWKSHWTQWNSYVLIFDEHHLLSNNWNLEVVKSIQQKMEIHTEFCVQFCQIFFMQPNQWETVYRLKMVPFNKANFERLEIFFLVFLNALTKPNQTNGSNHLACRCLNQSKSVFENRLIWTQFDDNQIQLFNTDLVPIR